MDEMGIAIDRPVQNPSIADYGKWQELSTWRCLTNKKGKGMI